MSVARILVTRADEDAGPLLYGLALHGLRGISVPLIERVIRRDSLAEAGSNAYDIWLLTSPFSVRALRVAGVDPGQALVASVGPSTTRAAEGMGWKVSVQPSVFTAAALVDALGDVEGQRVFYPRANLARSTVATALEARGAVVDDIVAYDNVMPEGAGAAIREHWPVDGVALLSGSAARRLVGAVPLPWPESLLIVAIGPSTAEVLAELGVEGVVVAVPHTVDGVIGALRRTLRGATGD